VSFTCEHCGREFAREQTIATHPCPPRERAELLGTELGQRAFSLYNQWRLVQLKPTVTAAVFADTKEFNTFLKLDDYFTKLGVAFPAVFMGEMKKLKLLPMHWKNPQCYSLYIKAIDFDLDPWKAVQHTLEFLQDLATTLQVELRDLAHKLGPHATISLLRRRELTPWVAFHAPSFKSIMRQMDPWQVKALTQAVNEPLWRRRFEDNHQLIEELRGLFAQLDI
jgi:hypothetical protein